MLNKRLDSYLEQQDQAERDWEAEPADRLDYLLGALQAYEKKHKSPLPYALHIESTGAITLWEGSRPVLNEQYEPLTWATEWEARQFLQQ